MTKRPEFAIGVLIKQIPAVTEMRLDSRGRLQRAGLKAEMNAYCRRAIAKAVELAAQHSCRCTVMTLGPASAEDVLREALAWGESRGVSMDAVHACDPQFAGSDTLATAAALSAMLCKEGPFDLILVGRNSLDSDTGQVGPQVAQLLDVSFAAAARELFVDVEARTVFVRCEHDDGWMSAEVALPAVVSTAERLIEPCKMPPESRADIAAERIRRLCATDLGAGPWGDAASPTEVGETRIHVSVREQRILTGRVEHQVAELVAFLLSRGVLDEQSTSPGRGKVGSPRPRHGRAVAAIIEPNRAALTRELLGAAAELATGLNGHVVAIGPDLFDADRLGSWGADIAVSLAGSDVEQDIAAGVIECVQDTQPSIMLAPSTTWGREIVGRVAASEHAGLVGDAVALELEAGRLVSWKPALGGQLLASIRTKTALQIATVRAGALPTAEPRKATASVTERILSERGGIKVLSRTRDDDLDVLATADAVVGIGSGVTGEDHELITPLLRALNAELAATRKVTDRGELPRARQIGITGRSISPRLYVALATSGKFNHTVGFRRAHTVVAVNNDTTASIFEAADIGLNADWRQVVPLLASAVQAYKQQGRDHTR